MYEVARMGSIFCDTLYSVVTLLIYFPTSKSKGLSCTIQSPDLYSGCVPVPADCQVLIRKFGLKIRSHYYHFSPL